MNDRNPQTDRDTLQLITEDMAKDAADFDGKPFDGRTVAEYFGYHGAAIAAIATIVRTMIPQPDPNPDPLPGMYDFDWAYTCCHEHAWMGLEFMADKVKLMVVRRIPKGDDRGYKCSCGKPAVMFLRQAARADLEGFGK